MPGFTSSQVVSGSEDSPSKHGERADAKAPLSRSKRDLDGEFSELCVLCWHSPSFATRHLYTSSLRRLRASLSGRQGKEGVTAEDGGHVPGTGGEGFPAAVLACTFQQVDCAASCAIPTST